MPRRWFPTQCEPVRVLERRAPVQLLHTPDGTPILDFGQNMAGVVRLDWQGSPGRKSPCALLRP